MIPLPAGCKVGYEIRFAVKDLTDDMGQWFQLQGGEAWATEDLLSWCRLGIPRR